MLITNTKGWYECEYCGDKKCKNCSL